MCYVLLCYVISPITHTASLGKPTHPLEWRMNSLSACVAATAVLHPPTAINYRAGGGGGGDEYNRFLLRLSFKTPSTPPPSTCYLTLLPLHSIMTHILIGVADNVHCEGGWVYTLYCTAGKYYLNLGASYKLPKIYIWGLPPQDNS
jgi:hypothetical protein